MDQCVLYAKARRHPEIAGKTIWDVFEEERPRLVPYAGRFGGFHEVQASVSKTCLVRFDNNRYSVNASAIGRPVDVHAYAEGELYTAGSPVLTVAAPFGQRAPWLTGESGSPSMSVILPPLTKTFCPHPTAQ